MTRRISEKKESGLETLPLQDAIKAVGAEKADKDFLKKAGDLFLSEGKVPHYIKKSWDSVSRVITINGKSDPIYDSLMEWDRGEKAKTLQLEVDCEQEFARVEYWDFDEVYKCEPSGGVLDCSKGSFAPIKSAYAYTFDASSFSAWMGWSKKEAGRVYLDEVPALQAVYDKTCTTGKIEVNGTFVK